MLILRLLLCAAFVRFDKEYSWGDEHDAFKEAAKRVGESSADVLMITVPISKVRATACALHVNTMLVIVLHHVCYYVCLLLSCTHGVYSSADLRHIAPTALVFPWANTNMACYFRKFQTCGVDPSHQCTLAQPHYRDPLDFNFFFASVECHPSGVPPCKL